MRGRTTGDGRKGKEKKRKMVYARLRLNNHKCKSGSQRKIACGGAVVIEQSQMHVASAGTDCTWLPGCTYAKPMPKSPPEEKTRFG